MKLKASFLLLLATTPMVSVAQTYPLTENTWSNPEFVERFTGSYGFDTEVTPSITSEEKITFEQIAPLIGSNPAEAIVQLKAVILPDSSPALVYTLANLYFQSDQLPEAEKAYVDAIKRFPNFLRAYRNLGIVYVQMGRYADATKMLLKAIQLGDQGADVYGMVGYSYLNSGKTEAALRSYEQALFFQPDSRDWRMGKVQCLMNLARYEDAIKLIDGLVEEFPAQTDLLVLQSNAYIGKGDTASAAATLEMLRASGKASTTALVLLGDIYINFGQVPMALELYESAVAAGDLSTDRAMRIAQRLANLSAWPEVDIFLTALDEKTGPQLADADKLKLLNLKAQADLAQGRTAEAAAKLDEVVKVDPLNGKALLLLADYNWKQGDIERAELYYERAGRLDEFAAEALVQRARMLVSQRDFRGAVPLLERAQSIRPQPYIGQYLEKVSSAALASAR